VNLTAKNVKALPLPAGKAETIVFDDDIAGFGLRIREGGSRTLIFQYKLGGKQRRIALGSVAALDFTKARKSAERLYARVKLGEDPAGDKIEAKGKAAQTFKATADDFLEIKKQELKARSYPDVERHMMKHAKVLHEMQVGSVTRADVAAVLTAARKNSGAVTANRVRATLSTFFGWCLGEGLIENNPVIGTNRNKEVERDRVLSPAELRLIWGALEDDDFGVIVKLLALTGQRASEIAGLRRSELCETKTGPVIDLPKERTKNHRPHVVPLSPAAEAAIAARPLRDRVYVFGLGEGPFSGWSKCKEALDARVTKTNGGKALPKWGLHDLRRSFSTHANELGVAPHIVEAVLNHVSGHKRGVAGTYNRATYEPEKRAALNLWAEQLMAWVEGRKSNVTPLRVA
jgi:integrase